MQIIQIINLSIYPAWQIYVMNWEWMICAMFQVYAIVAC